jgi:hypothetical protein
MKASLPGKPMPRSKNAPGMGTGTSWNGTGGGPSRAKSYDVFVSYNHQDREWVDYELVPRLEKAGFNLFFDRQNLNGLLTKSLEQFNGYLST